MSDGDAPQWQPEPRPVPANEGDQSASAPLAQQPPVPPSTPPLPPPPLPPSPPPIPDEILSMLYQGAPPMSGQVPASAPRVAYAPAPQAGPVNSGRVGGGTVTLACVACIIAMCGAAVPGASMLALLPISLGAVAALRGRGQYASNPAAVVAAVLGWLAVGLSVIGVLGELARSLSW